VEEKKSSSSSHPASPSPSRRTFLADPLLSSFLSQNAANYVSETVQGTTAERQKEANTTSLHPHALAACFPLARHLDSLFLEVCSLIP